MICSVCGEIIKNGEQFFEYFEPSVDGGSERVVMCKDCLDENLKICDEDDDADEISDDEILRIIADAEYDTQFSFITPN